MKIEYAFQVVWSPADNAYLAVCAELQGCLADGATQDEAIANLRVVIEEWIETAKLEGREIPQPMTTDDFDRYQQAAQAQLQQAIAQQVQNMVAQLLQSHVTEISGQWRFSAAGGAFSEEPVLVPAGHHGQKFGGGHHRR